MASISTTTTNDNDDRSYLTATVSLSFHGIDRSYVLLPMQAMLNPAWAEHEHEFERTELFPHHVDVAVIGLRKNQSAAETGLTS
jgi:hypothetical protein